ncbi:MAG: biotin carboxylase N-terminal domain-containing protein [Chitinophagales bacterium]|nr:biotin carboxylase N-terminal domain-containing protein [Chitinophagales bacterium]
MNHIRKILIANRGEIAIRIMRTCREMGIPTVAVFSDADRGALFVKTADEAVAIGGYNPSESYLDQEKIIQAALRIGADAIHPGYGFLSENATFALRCQIEGLTFIGPSPTAIEAMGDKKNAKQLVAKFEVPTVPGYDGNDQSLDALKYHASEVGYPLLLKASAGGGGKGMRIVRDGRNLEKEIEAAKREALSAFGDDTLLIERYFEGARHIEFQIFGDKHGNTIHLFERECSIQRRYQKIIEESPSPALDDDLRNRMAQAALNVARTVNYDNAGTVEFILDKDRNFYFLEVNTRLQVEHPVTEAITGLDLVKMQIDVARGLPLSITQDELEVEGHSIECRLYAEDPYNNYLPVSGRVIRFLTVENEAMRFDAGIENGSLIDVFYDPMIAKVISIGENREDAINSLIYALRKTVLMGLNTNKQFLVSVLDHEEFRQGKFDTQFLARHPELHIHAGLSSNALDEMAIAATIMRWVHRQEEQSMLRQVPSGWRNNFYQYQFENYQYQDQHLKVTYRYDRGLFNIMIADRQYEAYIVLQDEEVLSIEINGIRRYYYVVEDMETMYVHSDMLGDVALKVIPRFPESVAESIKGAYTAPMPGQVVKVLVQPGDQVKAGDGLLVLISMKMENTIEAFEEGVVEEVYVEEAGFVEADSLLLKISPITEEAAANH